MSRHYLSFRRNDVTALNTWWVLPDGKGNTIRAVIQIAEATPRTVEFPVYFRDKHPPSGAIHMHPLDGETRAWLLEPTRLHADLPHLEIQLEETPPMVGKHFREEL